MIIKKINKNKTIFSKTEQNINTKKNDDDNDDDD